MAGSFDSGSATYFAPLSSALKNAATTTPESTSISTGVGLVDPRQQVGERDAREPEGEGDELQLERASRQQDRQRGAEARRRGDAEDVGADERIAEHSLKRRAADRQAGADAHRHERARQPDLHDDRLDRLGPVVRNGKDCATRMRATSPARRRTGRRTARRTAAPAEQRSEATAPGQGAVAFMIEANSASVSAWWKKLA